MKRFTSFIILLLSISYASSVNLLKHVTKDDEVYVKSYHNLVPNHLTIETEMRMSRPMTTVLRQGTKLVMQSIFPAMSMPQNLMSMPQSFMSMMQSLVMPGVFMSGVMGTMMMNLVGFSLTSLVVGMILMFLRAKSSSPQYVWPFNTMPSSQSQPSSSSSSSPSSPFSPDFSPTLSGTFSPGFSPSLSLTGVFNASRPSSSSSNQSPSSSSSNQSPSKSQLFSYPSLPVQVFHIHVHNTMDNNGDPGSDDGPSKKVPTTTSSGWKSPQPSPLEITIAIKSNGQYISEG